MENVLKISLREKKKKEKHWIVISEGQINKEQ